MKIGIRNLRAHWLVAAVVGAMLLPIAGKGNSANADTQPNIDWNAAIGRAVLTNGPLELVVEASSGINARSLRDVVSGQVYADRDYVWQSGGKLGFPKLNGLPQTTEDKDGSRSITFKGRLGEIDVEQRFTLPKNEPGVILEQITISNPTDMPLDTSSFRCGFAKKIRAGEKWSADAAKICFCPIPYRRETSGQMQVFPLQEVAAHGMTYTGWFEPVVPTPIWGAEGWVWSVGSPLPKGEGTVGPHPNPLPKGEGTVGPHLNPLPKGEGTATFLLAKYNQQGMEWSLMEPVKRGNETDVRFGGAGQWKHNLPEGATRLAPGTQYQFGETRIQAVAGDWKQAYYAYRGYIDSKGAKRPSDYNPPVHWNELYDNEYFGRCGGLAPFLVPSKPGYTPELYKEIQKLLNQYYTLDLMKAEAGKANELGCEVLYLDPGWDTGERGGLHVWDAARLGPMKTFVEMIKKDYGLNGVSLWCSLAGVPPTYCDAQAYPSAQVLSKDGVKEKYLICHPCPGFLDAKEKLLLEVCRNGARFLMFDSDQYSGPCYDKAHGHSVPSTREEHAKATMELARRIKVKYPNVLIELHDPITGPSSIHYTPSYFGYNPPTSFDCLWGHEFMWAPLDDLLSRRAVSLYYYNLAYGIPIYLHVSLKQDNEHALVFWWFASTCRHLGVGGKPGPAAWEADKRAMKSYMPLKRFYTQGEFYGIDEMVHAHTLADLRQSVLNVFNLTDKPVERTVRLRPADVGLTANSIRVEAESLTATGGDVTIKVTIPAHGHQLVKVKAE
jgi:hypothetical protein